MSAGPSSPSLLDPGSFRDRQGRVYRVGDRVVRGLSAEALAAWKALAASPLLERLTARGALVATRELPADEVPEPLRQEGWAGFLEHERVPFVSYPFEWGFGMLRDAALLQLQVLDEALAAGFTLKDATPYNIQWIGARPVFIDVPSIEPYRPGQPWVGYRQFCELFLYPLLLHAYKGFPFQQLLRGRLDGIDPQACLDLMSWRDVLRPGVLAHVLLHAKAQARYADAGNVTRSLAAAGFHKELIVANVRKLRRLVAGLRPPRGPSAWVDYREDNSYDEPNRLAKLEVVRREVARAAGGLVWDLGANTGEHSRLAAEHARFVVALDSDVPTVERLYRELRDEHATRVLPLVVDLTDPSPGLGWRCRERLPLWERGRPDLVLALAVSHHLVITGNVPTSELVAWLAGLTGRLVVELVGKDDPMVQRLLANKEDHYSDYEKPAFEASLERHFVVEACEALPRGTRWLYTCRGRSAAGP